MTTICDFMTFVQEDCRRLETGLREAERKVLTAGDAAGLWVKEQADKLKAGSTHAKQKIAFLAECAEQESETAMAEAQDDLRRHWDALTAAVAAYRTQVSDSTNT